MILWWIKKDFRVSDNPALSHALQADEPVLAIFILEPSAMQALDTSARHVDAQLQAFKYLRRVVRACGGECCLIHDEVIPALDRLKDLAPQLSSITSHEEIGFLRTYERDKAVQRWCDKHAVIWTELAQTGVIRRLRDRDKRTELWREWMSDGPLVAPTDDKLRALRVPEPIMALWPGHQRRWSARDYGCKQATPLTETATRKCQPVSEVSARKVLRDFLDHRSIAYSGGISSPNTAFRAGSRLSVHLAWGTITGREVYQHITDRLAELKDDNSVQSKQFKKSLRAFLSRLHWRDHFIQRLESAPDMELRPLNTAYEALSTNDNAEYLDAWIAGRTGFPMVDACIRCAHTTGFLNFRMRCLITSTAVHSLRLDWRDILWPMAQWWTDYEPGIHVAQLQMQSGVVGINTLRVYSPAKQMADHDPDARFIRRWIPELADVPVETILSHQANPTSAYIQPLVNWSEATAAMKADYYAIRRSAVTKKLAEGVLDKHGSRKPASARKRTSGRRSKKTSANTA